jgi:hypothetical protein
LVQHHACRLGRALDLVRVGAIACSAARARLRAADVVVFGKVPITSRMTRPWCHLSTIQLRRPLGSRRMAKPLSSVSRCDRLACGGHRQAGDDGVSQLDLGVKSSAHGQIPVGVV